MLVLEITSMRVPLKKGQTPRQEEEGSQRKRKKEAEYKGVSLLDWFVFNRIYLFLQAPLFSLSLSLSTFSLYLYINKLAEQTRKEGRQAGKEK